MWFDSLAIPADAKHVEEAHAFINYPDAARGRSAKASNYVHYANGNLASQKFLDKEVIDDTGGLSCRRRRSSGCFTVAPPTTRDPARR